MITKKHIFLIIFFFVAFINSATKNQISFKPIVDTNGLIVMNKIFNNTYVCTTLNNQEIIAPIDGVQFIGGDDNLRIYLDSIYYNHPTFVGDHCNLIEFFYILFDDNLKIKEVRVIEFQKRSKEYEQTENRVRLLFKEALYKTEGLWIKNVPDSKWYVYLHRHFIR